VSAATPPADPILVARWRQDRRAGKGILIEGVSTSRMHRRVIGFVNGQAGRLSRYNRSCMWLVDLR
jgi:hypothetical protein